MPVRLKKRKNPAAAAPGWKGGKKGHPTVTSTDTSDRVVVALLKRLKAANDPNEVRKLSDQLERLIFHKQFQNACRVCPSLDPQPS
jgi:hypothetical protein